MQVDFFIYTKCGLAWQAPMLMACDKTLIQLLRSFHPKMLSFSYFPNAHFDNLVAFYYKHWSDQAFFYPMFTGPAACLDSRPHCYNSLSHRTVLVTAFSTYKILDLHVNAFY